MTEGKIQTIEEYISGYPPEIQEKMQALRKAINEAAPDSKEKISWGMPTFYLNGNLVHFAAHKNHIGFYPGLSGVEAFQEEGKEFIGTKSTFRFPYDKPIPLDLVMRVVQFRVAESIRDAEEKKLKKAQQKEDNKSNN